MEIFVASKSVHKVGAVREAFRQVFPDITFDIEGFAAKSRINEQPVGSETLQGAKNRLEHLKEILGERARGAILVALESGIQSEEIEGQGKWLDLAWVIIEDEEGKKHYSHSTGIEFDDEYVKEARRRGFETTTVGSVIAERTGADGTDPHKYLTADAVSRMEMLQLTIKTAFGNMKMKNFLRK